MRSTITNLSHLAAAAALAAGLFSVPVPAAAQQEPAIAELRIAIQDMATKQQRGYVNPGDTLELRVGERVRLRMVAIPAAGNRAPRYPSARFSELAGGGRIALSRVDAREGSAILEAVSTQHSGNPGATTLVRYELLDNVNIRKGLLQGTITVVVTDRQAVVPEPPAQRPERLGVTLFEHQGFRGRSETFFDDDPRLNDNLIRQDAASSIRVPRGCQVIVFSEPNYEGARTLFTEDVYDLRGSRVGNDTASSIQVDCGNRRGGNWGNVGGDRRDDGYGYDRRDRGVTLYEHQDFQGRSETFYESDPRLNDNPIRQDTASSVRVPRGCRVVLYEHPDYQGRATVLESDITDLNGTRVGNDSVSSIEVDCLGPRR
ncbi:MAG: hypothetical protein KDD11_14715 [Acidobacteria bacterium]|nr:hypothetical protein [Acidobacteriota bacterium]